MILAGILGTGCDSQINTSKQADTLTGSCVLPLSDEELGIYQKYSNTKDDQFLRNVSPIIICRLYFHAEKLGDIETRYSLYIQEDRYGTPAYQQFLSDLRSDTTVRENTRKLIKRLGEDTKVVGERKINNNESVVEIVPKSKSGSLLFRVIKNKKGIWKVDWLPLQ